MQRTSQWSRIRWMLRMVAFRCSALYRQTGPVLQYIERRYPYALEYLQQQDNPRPDDKDGTNFLFIRNWISRTTVRYRLLEWIPDIDALDARLKRQKEREHRKQQWLQLLPDKKEDMQRFRQAVRFWRRTRNQIPFLAIYDYIPKTREADSRFGTDVAARRKKVWVFKYAADYITPYQHAAVLTELTGKIRHKLDFFFGDDCRKLTFVCLPASNNASYQIRYREFARFLCKLTGMTDAMDHIHMFASESPKHLGGAGVPDYSIDDDWFNGRYVLLFDDVITTGASVAKMADKLEDCGTFVVGAIFMAETVNLKMKRHLTVR